MIVTNRFVFIHMHKTGGQSINQSLLNCVAGATEIGYHTPHSLLPQEFAQLPLVALVRNPWDWYVSWYAFNRESEYGMNNPLFRIMSDGGGSDFKTTISNLVRLAEDNEQSQFYRWALISLLPETLEDNFGVGLCKDDIRDLALSPFGYFSWLFNRMIGNAKNKTVHIGRFENLQEDFIRLMHQLCVDESTQLQAELAQTEINSSSHSHYSRYYDEELRDLVADKESKLIGQFGYEFHPQDDGQELIALPDSYSDDPNFKKLLGRARNYLLLKEGLNTANIVENIQQLPEQAWYGSNRENEYEAHQHTHSLLLIHDSDFRHVNPTYQPLYDHFQAALKPIIECIAAYYQGDGYVVRALLTRLPGGGGGGAQINVHSDNYFSLLNCHRIHIPIVTNPGVIFCVGGERKNLKSGEMWEINNATTHWVRNDGDRDRVHLIIDWVPNSHSSLVTGTPAM